MADQHNGLAALDTGPLGLTVLSGLGGAIVSTYFLLSGNRNAILAPAPTVTAKMYEAPTRISFVENHSTSRLDSLLTSIGLRTSTDDNDSWGMNPFEDDPDIHDDDSDIYDTQKPFRDALDRKSNYMVATILASYFNDQVQTAWDYIKACLNFMYDISRRLDIPLTIILRHLLWDLRRTLHNHYILMASILIVAFQIAAFQKEVRKTFVAFLWDQNVRSSQHYRLIMELFGRGKQLNERLIDLEDHIDNHVAITESDLDYFSQMVPALFAAVRELQDQRDTLRIEDTPSIGIEDVLRELADVKRTLAEERNTMAKKFDDAVTQMQRDMDEKISRAVEEAVVNKARDESLRRSIGLVQKLQQGFWSFWGH